MVQTRLLGNGTARQAPFSPLARRPRADLVTLVPLGSDGPRRTIQVVAQPAASRSAAAAVMLEVLIAHASDHGLVRQAASGLPPTR